jgi:fructose-bisphosphate aldolase class I
MPAADLDAVARAMVAPGKGILAADESTGTIKKRFDSIGVASSEATRRDWREALLGARGLGEHVSGVILYDETLRQSAADGRRFVELLAAAGVLPGIKVDTGAKPLPGHPGEKVTEGLDGLTARLEEYAALGARFTKWRAVITIGPGIPSPACVEANAHALARYAAASQACGLVPIVEPEVLMDGAHDLARCEEVTTGTLEAVFAQLRVQGVRLEGMVLKPSMVISGSECPERASVEEAAVATVRCLRRTVPVAVPGIAFLSGGQSDEDATAHLNAMNALGPSPWQLTFSYGRALQAPALQAWRGKRENFAAARAALLHRARMNGLARTGSWSPAREAAGAVA